MEHGCARGATRRELLGAGLALAAAGSAAALESPATAEAAAETDAQLLTAVVGTQLLTIFTYQHVLDSALMTVGHQEAATRMLGQVHRDLHAFKTELIAVGGSVPPPPAGVTDADKVLIAHSIPNSLAHLRSERDCLTVLVRVENLLTGAYYTPITKLSDTSLAALSMQAMASSAQHFSVLNELLHPGNLQKAVPGPFVYGAR